MKNEKKLKEYETVWTCDFCGEEFKTKNESDKHELVCDKNPDSVSFPLIRNTKKSWLILWITTMVVFGITVYVNSKLLSLGFNLFNKKWFLNLFFGNIILGIVAFLGTVFSKNKDKKKVFSVVKYSFILCLIYLICHAGIILSLDTSFKEQERKSDYLTYQEPTPKTELQNVKYNGKVISGAVVNKSDKPIFNSKVVLKISKDRTAWEIDETHEFIVPYKIDPNQSINFSENYKTTKKDPWWTTLIQESHFYNGEVLPTPTIDPDPIIDCKFTYVGTKQLKRSVCSNATDCEIEKGKWYLYYSVNKCKEDQQKYYAGTLEGHPYTNNQTNTNIVNTTTQYPACAVYYPGLKKTETYYHLSPEKCIEEKNKVNSSSPNTSSTITCVVNYPCTGKSYTYQVDQNTCDFMQSGAKSTCSTYEAINNMNEIAHPTINYPQASPIDGSIHMDNTPTPVVPYGYHN